MELALGNVFARRGKISVGGQVDGHTHNFDHVTACKSGRIRVQGRRNGELLSETVLEMGDVCLILADVEHTLIQEPGIPPLVRLAMDSLRDRLLAAIPDAAEAIQAAYAATEEAHGNVEADYFCLYAHRTPQGDVVQEYTGWPEAYR